MPKIKKGLMEGKTITQIAEDCNVYEKTIDRDMRAWVDSGEFEIWLKEEWLRVYVDIKKIKPIVAFEALNNLVGKMLTRKIERKEQIEIRSIELKWALGNEQSSSNNQVQPT
jgi:IS30 family transposase